MNSMNRLDNQLVVSNEVNNIVQNTVNSAIVNTNMNMQMTNKNSHSHDESDVKVTMSNRAPEDVAMQEELLSYDTTLKLI